MYAYHFFKKISANCVKYQFLLCNICKLTTFCDHLTAVNLTSPGIFGMAGVWLGAPLPDLNDNATGSDI